MLERGKWHYIPEIPETECKCMIRVRGKEFVTTADFIWLGDKYVFCIIVYDNAFGKYSEDYLHGDEIECWCGLEELAELLDKKEEE